MKIPVVAIIGRPNVGKSTLFNRIIHKPLAITDERPGVTRDRNTVEFEWNTQSFMLVDTGGFVISSHDQMEQAVTEQSRIAIEEADVILFLVDVQTGITDMEYRIRDEIIKSGKPVVLTVNKIDRGRDEYDIYEFYNLGLGEPFPVSGKTGRGTGDLLDEVVMLLPRSGTEKGIPEPALRIAFIGRPNVGKSSLVNVIVGYQRALVTDIPGTTRDSTDTYFRYQNRDIVIVDTAGLKRVTKLKESIEYYCYLRTQTSMARCDVAVVVLDISQGMTTYDKALVDDVVSSGKSLIIAANKWDLVPKDHRTMKEVKTEIYSELPDKTFCPTLFTSALTGKRAMTIIETAFLLGDARKLRIQTSELNTFFETLLIPPGAGYFNILYGTQEAVEPPSFVVFVNDHREVKDNFVRFLEKTIREKYGFPGTPIKISIRSRKNKH